MDPIAHESGSYPVAHEDGLYRVRSCVNDVIQLLHMRTELKVRTGSGIYDRVVWNLREKGYVVQDLPEVKGERFTDSMCLVTRGPDAPAK